MTRALVVGLGHKGDPTSWPYTQHQVSPTAKMQVGPPGSPAKPAQIRAAQCQEGGSLIADMPDLALAAIAECVAAGFHH